MNTQKMIPGTPQLFSSDDLNKSDSKMLLLDKVWNFFHENPEEPSCSTCDKLILKLSQHVLSNHGLRQSQNTSETVPNVLKRNLRSRKRINYSEKVEDSIPARKLPKTLKTPCDVLSFGSATSTSASDDYSAIDITNPQIKMEDLDMDMDFPDCPEFGGSNEEETKIDINYLTGADMMVTTVVPDNITVITSSVEKLEKLSSPCIICKKEFPSAQELDVHLRESHPREEKPYICTHIDCGKLFLNETRLKIHSKTHTVETFSCDVCGKIFTTQIYLKRHKAVHSKPIICDECGKGFAKNFELEVHKRSSHSKEKPSTCTICGKGFAENNYLYLHMTRLHSESEEMKTKCICELCGKSYKTKSALNAHMIVHSGQKPFVCGECGKSFFYKNDLEVHMVVHTGERAFACDICPKSFKHKNKLVIHLRSHTGEKPFVCEICKKGFSSKTNLNGHLTSHSDARPFVCQTCNLTFKWVKHLKRHRKQVHTSENS